MAGTAPHSCNGCSGSCHFLLQCSGKGPPRLLAPLPRPLLPLLPLLRLVWLWWSRPGLSSFSHARRLLQNVTSAAALLLLLLLSGWLLLLNCCLQLPSAAAELGGRQLLSCRGRSVVQVAQAAASIDAVTDRRSRSSIQHACTWGALAKLWLACCGDPQAAAPRVLRNAVQRSTAKHSKAQRAAAHRRPVPGWPAASRAGAAPWRRACCVARRPAPAPLCGRVPPAGRPAAVAGST